MKRKMAFLLVLALLNVSLFAQTKYYIDDTCKDMKIAVPESKGINLNKDESWIPVLIQTQITDTIKKFSPITVIDRQNEKQAMAEIALSESGLYSDSDYVEFGNFVNAKYIVASQLINNKQNYSLSIRINNIETNTTVASYSSTCFPKEIRDGSVINNATYDLLTQLGVKLTDEGEKLIKSSVNENTIQAQASLSKGIDAQKRGTIVETLKYYYEAAEFDKQNAELTSRLNSIQSTVQSGNLGDDIRNEIANFSNWKKITEDANAFFMENPPYDIMYSTKLEHDVDFSNKNNPKANILCRINLAKNSSAFKTINTIQDGLQKADPDNKWGLRNWARDAKYYFTYDSSYYINLAIKNDMEEIIGTRLIHLELVDKEEDGCINYDNMDCYKIFISDPSKVSDRLSISLDGFSFKWGKSYSKPIPEGCTEYPEDSSFYLQPITSTSVGIFTIEEIKNRLEQEKAAQLAIEKQLFVRNTAFSLSGLTDPDKEIVYRFTTFMELFDYGNFSDYRLSQVITECRFNTESKLDTLILTIEMGFGKRLLNFFDLYGFVGIGYGYIKTPEFLGFIPCTGGGIRIGRKIKLFVEYTIDYIYPTTFFDKIDVGILIRGW